MTLRRFASLEDMPLYFCFHLSKALLETEYLRQTSAMELPGSSDSEIIWMILSTGYFDLFIVLPPFRIIYIFILLHQNGEQVTLIAQTPLSPATGVYGQFPGRDFNPLDSQLLLRTVS
jgi:hypothetical protein